MHTHHRARQCTKAQDAKYAGGRVAVEKLLFVRAAVKGVPIVRIPAFLLEMNITEMPELIEKNELMRIL